MSYAIDLGLEISTQRGSDRRRVEQVTANRGILRFVSKQVETRTYTVRNKSDRPRVVVLEQPIRSGWEVTGEHQPAETSADDYRFRLTVPSQETLQYQVTEEHPDETIYQVSDLRPEQLELWIRDKTLPQRAESALQPILEAKRRVAGLQSQLADLSAEEQQIFKDQERVRGNLSGLNQTAEESRLRQRYIDQLEAQEDRLDQIQSQRQSLQSELRQAQDDLSRLIGNLSF